MGYSQKVYRDQSSRLELYRVPLLIASELLLVVTEMSSFGKVHTHPCENRSETSDFLLEVVLSIM